MTAQLDVYVEQGSAFLTMNYILEHMLRGLRPANLTYRILEQFDPSDVGERAFVHVDLTELPKQFRDIHEYYPRCVNGRAVTISRLLYSRARVLKDDAYDGPVIVKTVLNSRGIPEFSFDRKRSKFRKIIHTLRALTTPDYEARVCPTYQVYTSTSEVPATVWSNRRLMVERFLPGRLDLPIVKHRLDFFYDIELNIRSTHHSLLCDPETVITAQPVTDVPDEVMGVRRTLNLDFGSIDYFVIGDEVFVIDANKTTTLTPSWVEQFPFVARYLRLATERLIDLIRGAQIPSTVF